MWMLGAKLPGPFGTYAPSPGPPLWLLHYLVIFSNIFIISPFLFKFSSFITLRFLVSFLSFHLFYVWSYWFLLFSSEKLPRIFCYSGIKLRSSHTLNPHLPAELQPQPQGCCCFTYSLYHHLLCLWCGPPLKVGSILWAVCFPHCLCPLGSCLPRSYAFSSVRCLLLWVVPLPHFLLSPGGRGPVPWEPYCSLCCPFLLLWVLEVVDLAKDCSACAVWPHQAWERRGGRRLQSLFTMPTQ